MLKSVLLLALFGTGILALPAKKLTKAISRVDKDGMTDRNIYQYDSDDDSIAVSLQRDTSWPNDFTMSLYCVESSLADVSATEVFADKTWAQLESYKVDWGDLQGQTRVASIDGLKSGTEYTLYTIVQDSSGNNIGGQSRDISTTGTKKSLEKALEEVINKLKAKVMTVRNIYQYDADDDSIAVSLQRDTSWPNDFTMSLYYVDANVADRPATEVFADKTWAELASYQVDWGKLQGQTRVVDFDGLSPGTAYTVYTVVQDSSGNSIGGQSRDISTTGSKKSLDKELEELINKLKNKEMSNRNIYQTDSDSDSIAVYLQKDVSWGNDFTVSLYYNYENVADRPSDTLFSGKSWSELERSEWAVDWGKFNGFKYAVSIDGLRPDTAYVVKTEIKDSSGTKIGGQSRVVSTKAAKSLDVKALLKALKDLV